MSQTLAQVAFWFISKGNFRGEGLVNDGVDSAVALVRPQLASFKISDIRIITPPCFANSNSWTDISDVVASEHTRPYG